MAFDYIETQNDADELIAEFGQPAVLRTPGIDTSPDPADPSFGAPVDISCTVVVTDFDRRLIDGSLIRYGDKQVLVSPKGLGAVPEPGVHSLLIGGEEHAIVPPLTTVAPAGVPVLYILQARR